MSEADAALPPASSASALDLAEDGGAQIVTTSSPPYPIVAVNQSWVALCGFTRAEALGETCKLIQGPQTSLAVLSALHAALAQHKPITVRGTLTAPEFEMHSSNSLQCMGRGCEGVACHMSHACRRGECTPSCCVARSHVGNPESLACVPCGASFVRV